MTLWSRRDDGCPWRKNGKGVGKLGSKAKNNQHCNHWLGFASRNFCEFSLTSSHQHKSTFLLHIPHVKKHLSTTLVLHQITWPILQNHTSMDISNGIGAERCWIKSSRVLLLASFFILVSTDHGRRWRVRMWGLWEMSHLAWSSFNVKNWKKDLLKDLLGYLIFEWIALYPLNYVLKIISGLP